MQCQKFDLYTVMLYILILYNSYLQELRITEETFQLMTSYFMESQQDDLNWESFNT